jgi:hypothetical protein
MIEADPMPELIVLNEADLRQLIGLGQFKRAEAFLASGKVVERYASPEGDITAYWENTRSGIEMILKGIYPKMTFDCSCGQTRARTLCDHVAALALAWARQPESFVESWPDEAEAEDYDDDLGAPPAAWAETLRLEPPDLRAEYTRLLSELNPAALHDVIRRRGVKVAGASRETFVATVAEALSQPENLRATWATLSPPARLALKVMPFLVPLSESVQGNSVKQALQTLDPEAAAQVDSALKELIGAGLLFFNRYRGFDFPRAITFHLPPSPGFVPALNEDDKSSRHLRVEAGARPLDFALLTTRLLLMLKAEGSRLRARPEAPLHPLLKQLPSLQHWPYVPAELDALAKEPNPAGAAYRLAFTVPSAPSPLADEARTRLTRELATDPAQLDFAVRLLAALGLIELSPGRPVTVAEARMMDFLRLSPIERTAALLNAWINLISWTEYDRLADRRPAIMLRHRGNAYGATYAQMLTRLAQTRLALLLQVRNALAGQWSDVHALTVRARGLNQLNGIWPSNYDGWYPDWNKREPNMHQANDWNAIYGPYVDAVLTGPFQWLGLVDLAYHKDQLAGFRPTALGAFIFCQATEFVPPPIAASGPALHYGGPRRATRSNGRAAEAPAAQVPAADLSVTLQVEASNSQLLTLLSLLGEAQSGPAGTLVYTITAAGASRAFEAGWEVDAILTTLAQAAGQPAPESLAQALSQWQKNFGDVHIYSNLALLELADDYILAELMASTTLAQHLLYRFSPRLVALRPEGVEALQAELVKKNYTPKMKADI